MDEKAGNGQLVNNKIYLNITFFSLSFLFSNLYNLI